MASNNKAYLHSVQSHGPWYFYETLESAVNILKNLNIDHVIVIFHPSHQSNLILFRLFRKIKQIFALSAKTIGCIYANRLIRKPHGSSSYAISKPGLSSMQSKSKKQRGIYDKVFLSKETVDVSTGFGTISISLSNKSLYRNDIHFSLVSLKALWILRKYLKPKRFRTNEFLSLTYHNTIIGDLIASTALRLSPRAGGSIQKCRFGIFSSLINGIAIRDYVARNIYPLSNSSYIMVPEPTYNVSIYKRSIHQLGGTVIETHHYSGKLKTVPSRMKLSNPGIIQKKSGSQRKTPMYISQICDYLEERMENPSSSLWYMFNGVNNKEEVILSSDSREIIMHDQELHVCLFLHSFDDGQYYYGTDGFDDLWEWTVVTIDSLLKNSAIGNILIKPHPNMRLDAHSGDSWALLYLEKCYEKCSRVKWLKKDTSLKALAKYSSIVGITHHGSIAEELFYLGIPVIASRNAPWGETYPFPIIWRSVCEYKDILDSLDLEFVSKRKEEDEDNFKDFIYEYRISSPGLHHVVMRKKLALLLGISECSFTKMNGLLSDKLRDLCLDSNNLNSLIMYMTQEADCSPLY